jgi:mono/diheme cytochrome c family protein
MKSRRSPSTPSRKSRRSVCAALLACSLIVTTCYRRAVDVVAAGNASIESSPDGMPSRGPDVTTADMHGETADTRTVTIVLPHEEPTFPDGPGQRQFLTSCVVCHSPRYISMQPHFPQHVWASEVHKMVTAYGAHVTPGEEAEIVTYIMTIRGADTTGHSNDAAHGGGDQP